MQRKPNESEVKESTSAGRQTTFAPILEEENYDNVIIKEQEGVETNDSSESSYLSAISFASVYNFAVR